MMQCILDFMSGDVWKTAPVNEQPSLTLVRWQVMQLPNGDRHFVGYAVENKEGRASTAVATFDATSLKCVTASGRVYKLSGRPGHDGDAEYVWQAWRRINDAPDWTDITAQVWAAHVEARKPAAESDEGALG